MTTPPLTGQVVRSNGHNLEGWSNVDGGLRIDVSRLKSIELDEVAGTASVGTGLLQKEVVAALGEHGCTIPTGSEGGVAGEFGLLTRRMGLGCDHLLVADIVVADGTDSVWYGGTRADITAALAPLLATGSPDVTITEGAWPAVYTDVDKAAHDVANWKFLSQFVKRPFPDEAIDLICRYMANSPAPASNYFLSSFGGAVRNEPPGGSAFPHRDALFYCEPGAGWNGPELTPRALGWVADFERALRPHVDGAYVNVPNAGAADWEAQHYSANADRLRRVKASYDPHNVFTFEHSIPGRTS
jgi:FAD/FMN-containing dehydrogenase